MKLLNIWLAFIVMTSALLLGAANVSALSSMNPSAQSQETSNANKQQEGAKASAKPSSAWTATPTTQISKPTAGQKTGSADDCLDPKWFDWYAAFGPSTWSNWVLALFAVVATVVGLRSLGRIKEQNREAAISLKINRAAASAAKKSADTAEKSVVELERPWLFIDIVKFDGFRRGIPQAEWVDQPLLMGEMRWTIRNYGRSPAFVFDGAIRLHAINKPLPEPPNYTTNAALIPIPMAPNKIQRNRIPWMMDVEDYKRVIKGDADLVFYGFIRYRDTFLKREHVSRWCATLKLPRLRITGDPDWYWEFSGPPSYTEYT